MVARQIVVLTEIARKISLQFNESIADSQLPIDVVFTNITKQVEAQTKFGALDGKTLVGFYIFRRTNG
ncbi:hypothetical protein [Pedobacter sp. V48]|uniref:hypothetical protein n=1 Tax=Pedobacter sp. V48 TaxID=509635 RepID=UPI0003E54F76|nr:hypothetical protein [Pedobacter sp. V48]ETZ20944.1 hypothetical protein N824_02205 [Pedobacter sp. V48]